MVPVTGDEKIHFHLIQPAKIFAKVFAVLQRSMKGYCSSVFIVDLEQVYSHRLTITYRRTCSNLFRKITLFR